MPIYTGNTTVNSAITSTSLTEMSPQSYLVTNALRNTVRPTLLLPFNESTVVDPRITFTRASSATYFNKLGVLTTAAANVPRIDYNSSTGACLGLLIEQSSTNVYYPSTNWWPNSSPSGLINGVTQNAGVGPDGSSTAMSLVPSTTNTIVHYNYGVFTASPSTTYTCSVFLKANGYSFARIGLENSSFATNMYVSFDLSAGTITSQSANSSGTITACANGWYRVTVTNTTLSTIGNTVASIFVFNTGTGASYAGDGVSGILAWGIQAEALSFSTSYIATTSAAATRSADLAVISGTNFSSWYNTTASTILIAAQKNTSADTGYGGVVELNNNTVNNRLQFYVAPSSKTLHWADEYTSNTTDADLTVGTYTLSTAYRAAGSITGALSTSGNISASLNGVTAVTGTTGNFPGVSFTQMQIGSLSGGSGGNFMNGWIQRIAYYPVAFSTTQLQAMTS